MLECFSVGDFDATNWVQTEAAFAEMKALEFGRTWPAEQAADFAPGEVRLGWKPDALWVLATLRDADIFSESTADGQPMWRLGDVFEIFVRALPGVPWYEFHITPNNHHLELYWPDDPETSLRLEKQLGYEAFIAPHSLIETRVRVQEQRWQILARVPAKAIGAAEKIDSKQEWLISFCRYDASRDGRAMVLSSTSPFKEELFNRQQEWSRLIFVK
jgi:hypothetical protein